MKHELILDSKLIHMMNAEFYVKFVRLLYTEYVADIC